MLTYRKQVHSRGCGIACVAMLAGVSYEYIRDDYDEMYGAPEAEYFPRKKAWALEYGTTISDLHCLLEVHNIKSNKRLIPFKSWDALPDYAILAVNYRKNRQGNDGWHWAVFDRDENIVYDPWMGEDQRNKGLKQNIRTDYKRMRPRFYMGVFFNEQ